MSAKKPVEEKIANIAPFGLRMLPELKERIAQAAEASGRSMNAEIVGRLELSLEEDIWEREKFINLLDRKQSTIDMMMHMLSAEIARQRALEDQVAYERALRQSAHQALQSLHRLIQADETASDDLKDAVALLRDIGDAPVPTDTRERDRAELAKRVGDRDEA